MLQWCEYMREPSRRPATERLTFIQMVSEVGGPGTARRLLASSKPSEGFTRLWESGRLDLSVEYQVLQPQFRGLFSEEELDVARKRLRDYGFNGPL